MYTYVGLVIHTGALTACLLSLLVFWRFFFFLTEFDYDSWLAWNHCVDQNVLELTDLPLPLDSWTKGVRGVAGYNAVFKPQE